MSLRYVTRYERWSCGTPQVWTTGRRVQVMNEVYVMTRVVANQRRKAGDERSKKLAAVKAKKWMLRGWRRKMRKSCGEEWSGTDFQENRWRKGWDQPPHPRRDM